MRNMIRDGLSRAIEMGPGNVLQGLLKRIDGNVTCATVGTADELAALEESYGLLQRDIAAVDLRLSDRITIRLSHPAAEQRRAAQGKAKAKRAETET